MQNAKKILDALLGKRRLSIRYPNVQVMMNSHVSLDTEIGEYSYIGFNCSITRARLGRYVSVANNVSIGNGEHDYRRISTSSIFYENAYEELTALECGIGNDVWIGVDSIVRRGVKIGNGAVVGANSFVNKDVPPFAIVVGSPARIVKYRFPPEVIAKIEASHWWDFEPDEARRIISTLEESSRDA